MLKSVKAEGDPAEFIPITSGGREEGRGNKNINQDPLLGLALQCKKCLYPDTSQHFPVRSCRPLLTSGVEAL